MQNQHSENIKVKIDYWKKELSGAPNLVQIPTDYSRSQIQKFAPAEHLFSLNQKLTENLDNLEKSMDCDLQSILLTAFGLLLLRYSSQEDFVVGLCSDIYSGAGSNGEAEGPIKDSPIRFSFADESNFSENASVLKTKVQSAIDNLLIFDEKIIKEIKETETGNLSDLFNVLFGFVAGFDENSSPSEKDFGPDLYLQICKGTNSLECKVIYNSELFAHESIARLGGHYNTILSAISGDALMPVLKVPLLTREEEDLILNVWNATQTDLPKDKCIHHRFEEQVERTPDAIAVEFEGKQITYAELNTSANQLANYLISQGAHEDKYVALFVERGFDMITGLLAISKTGATYLPLDPIYPKARLFLIVDDAKPVIIITQESLIEAVPESNAKVVFIDKRSEYNNESSENLSLGDASKPAYILYTSGSTGKPKGVPVNQHAVVNLVNSMTKLLSFTQHDILLAVTTISFDIAELEMYMPLFIGAKLVIATQETATDMNMLTEKMIECKATVFQATPVTFKMLMINDWKGKADLKLIIGGEALSKELVRHILPRCAGIWNSYGPTETAIYSVVRNNTMDDTIGEGYVPIGRPVDNTVVYILNKKLVPVPIGIPGELWIGGDGISPGYLNLPNMTDERFIVNPFGKSPDEKIYKTGDLVQYFNDGNMVFLNRLDTQVKIRGFRIELGEIESAISQFNSIKNNVVIVREDTPGDKKLVGYIIKDDDKEVDIVELRQFLKSKIPDYMVPAAFVFLRQFPVTPNGKIDRKVLPSPVDAASIQVKPFIAPQTETEKKLAEIWSSVLKINNIGTDEDFFEIGGHSLVAVTLMVKIEKELGKRLPLAILFNNSTIRDMAQVIDQKSERVTWGSLVPIRPKGTKKPLYLVHSAGLNLLLYTTVVAHLDPEQPVFGLQAKGLDGIDEPLDSFEEIAAYYISEILEIDKSGSYSLAGFSMGGQLAYEMARQLVESGNKVNFLGVFDTVSEDAASDHHIPFLKRYFLRFILLINQIFWVLGTFLKMPLNKKYDFFVTKVSTQIKKITKSHDKLKPDGVSLGKQSELPKYLHKVHRANFYALERYVLPPYPGKLTLFKAMNQTFYIKDPARYGWGEYVKELVIHDIPGEHSRIFAPPNDEQFASVLQKCLDEREY